MARLSSVPSPESHLPAAKPVSTAEVPLKQALVEPTPDTAPDRGHKSVKDDRSLHPKGNRSFAFIGIQAFVLGNILSACLFSTVCLIQYGSPFWRLTSFFVFLSLFHYLEFDMTARFNAPATKASSFLLFNNGSAYTLAHTMATAEIIATTLLFQPSRSFLFTCLSVVVGLSLIVVGQGMRSVAMAQAGTNFNHIIAHERRQSHVLVTDGVYGIVRHPSYFGFFWWAIGTQVLVGNKISLLGYAVVLWRFFNTRIQAEERFLVQFFDEKYIDFRKRTPTGIPFIP